MHLVKKLKNYYLSAKHRKFLDLDLSIYRKFLEKDSVFVHIPKTAGRSIISSIYGEDLKNCGHRTYFFYKYLFRKKRIEKMYTFSFVRNPYTRLLSAYNFLKNGGENKHDINAKKKFIDSYCDFNNFINFGLENVISNNVVHFVPQHHFITDGKKTLVDFVGKYETLENDLKKVSTIIKFNSPFQLNKQNFNSYEFSKKNCDIIEKVYEKDFLIFNYK